MIRVVTIPTPSKREAVLAGDRVAAGFPRIYVDADVELGTGDIRALAEALDRPGVLAAGPTRILATAGRPRLVRWYYDVWMRLPEVRDGLFGRGVIGVGAAGHARIATLPPLLSDDLGWSLMFGPSERAIVPDARAVVHTPRTVADLLRRRIRAATGVTQLENTEDTPQSTARTRLPDLIAISRREPRMAPRVLVFLAVAVAARWQSRKATSKGRLFNLAPGREQPRLARGLPARGLLNGWISAQRRPVRRSRGTDPLLRLRNQFPPGVAGPDFHGYPQSRRRWPAQRSPTCS